MKQIVTLAAALTALLAASAAQAQLSGKTIKIAVGGPLTTGSATFGVEQRQAVELAVKERNAKGGILGAQVGLEQADDKATTQDGDAVAQKFCDDPAVLAVVGHVNSNVTISAEKVYARCGLAMITPMSSNPGVTEQGLSNVFRLTNRDDHKGPAFAKYLHKTMGKNKVVVIDDQTAYGKGLADSFAASFAQDGGKVLERKQVKVGDTDFAPLVASLPKDLDLVFYGGIAEAPMVLKEMRAKGLTQLFACGDGCWSVGGFIKPAGGATAAGEGVRILSAAPALGKVPGSGAFAERYTKAYGPIQNYAASSYDSARLVMAAIETAAKAAKGTPSRAAVLAALRAKKFQGIAYAKPVQWNAKGDNTAAVIFVNTVDGDKFREVAEIR